MAITALAAGPHKLTDPDGVATQTSSGRVPEAGDAANKNSFVNTGVEVLVVDNVGGSARTLIVEDKNGNALATINIAANKCQVVGPFDKGVHNQAGDLVVVRPSHAELELVVFQLLGAGRRRDTLTAVG